MINNKLYGHHIQAQNYFFDPSSPASYSLNNTIKIIVEELNDKIAVAAKNKGDFPSFEIPAGHRAFSLLNSDNKYRKIAKINLFLNYRGSREKVNYFLTMPCIDGEGLWLENGNYYNPFIRLLKKPCVKILSGESEEPNTLEFELMTHENSAYNVIFRYKNNSMSIKLKPRSKYFTSSEADNAELNDDEALDDDKSTESEECNSFKFIDCSDSSFKDFEEYKIICGLSDDKIKKFILSENLRDIINSRFGCCGKSNEYLTEKDIDDIKKFLDGCKNKFKAFIEFHKYHFSISLDNFDAVSVNEAYQSAILKVFRLIMKNFKISSDYDSLLIALPSVFESISTQCVKTPSDKKKSPIAGFELIDNTNALAKLSNLRKVSFVDSNSMRAIAGDGVDHAPKALRDIHISHIARLCPIETPESEKIGLVLFMAKNSELQVEHSRFTARTVSGNAVYEDEEKAFMRQFKYSWPDILSGKKGPESPMKFEYEFINWKKSETCPYKLDCPTDTLSYSSLMIPFIEHTDASRALMGSKNMKSSIPLVNPEPPIIITGFEGEVFKNHGITVESPVDGTVDCLDMDDQKITIKIKTAGNKIITVVFPSFRENSAHSFEGFVPAVFTGDPVKKGTRLVYSSLNINGGDSFPLCGRNLLAAYAPFYGYNFEDGIVISDALVNNDALTSIHIETFVCLDEETIVTNIIEKHDGAVEDNADEKNKNEEIDIFNVAYEIRKQYLYKDLNANFTHYYKTKKSELKIFMSDNKIFGKLIKVKCVLSKNYSGKISNSIILYYQKMRKIEVGDKLMARYGNKGVVARIVPQSQMPLLPDKKTRVEIILNPNGVISRMNMGQIFETQFSPAVRSGVISDTSNGRPFDFGSKINLACADENALTGLINGMNDKFIESGFKYDEGVFKVNLLKETVENGVREYSPYFDNAVVTGYQYFVKLNHLAALKIHARSEDKYTMKHAQPVKGKSRGGGQRAGEMELWCMLSAGADNVLKSVLNYYSQHKPCGLDISEASVTLAMKAWLAALGLVVKHNESDLKYFVNDILSSGGGVRKEFPEKEFFDSGNSIFGFKEFNEFKSFLNEIECKSFFKSPGDLLFNPNYYGEMEFKRLGNELYKKYGIIPLPYPIVHPLCADKLFNEIKTDAAKLFEKNSDDYLKIIDSAEYALKINKNIDNKKKRQSHYDNIEIILNMVGPLKNENDFAKKIYEAINACSIHYILIPPLIARITPEIKESLDLALKNSKVTGENKTKKENFNIRFNEKDDFIHKQYYKIIKSVNNYYNLNSVKKNNKNAVNTNEYEDLYFAVRKLMLGKEGILSFLATKSGLLRNEMLGRRMDFSGRAVIVPEPELKLGEISLPLKIAEKFFENEIEKNYHKEYFQLNIPGRTDFLNQKIIRPSGDVFIILNRQPSLHRFSMQSFKISEITSDSVIRLHPFSCAGLGADFDGDMAAVYYFSKHNQEIGEQFGIHNNMMLYTASEKHLLHYEQDFNLGEYLLFKTEKYFNKLVEIINNFKKQPLPDRLINLAAKFEAGAKNKKIDLFLLAKTAVELKNESDADGFKKTLELIDSVKTLVLYCASKKGVSFGADDLISLKKYYEKGGCYDGLKKDPAALDGNGIKLLCASGARDNQLQIEQLVLPRGIMQTIRRDEKSGTPAMVTEKGLEKGLFEGHGAYDYFISAHGSRCGVGQKKLLTPKCGYFTRTLVEAMYDYKVTADDCMTVNGISVKDFVYNIKNFHGGSLLSKLPDILKYCFINRYAFYKGGTGRILITADNIDEVARGEDVFLMSPIYCGCAAGVCSKCYGLAGNTGASAAAGLRAGIIAGQTIGERGTQLAMKMFHGGGVYSKEGFGDSVEELVAALKENKKAKLPAKDAFYKIIETVIKSYIVKQKVNMIHFEVLLKSMIEKGIVEYDNYSAGLKNGRDFLSKISYKNLSDVMKKYIFDLAVKNQGAANEQFLSDKAKILFSI